MENNGNSAEVALVSVPWGSITRPSIALGILKQCAIRAGIRTQVHYLNMKFAERIGLELYESISYGSAFHPEWFFCSHLSASEEPVRLRNRWEDLQGSAEGRAMADKLVELCGGSAETCQSVAAAVPGYIAECLQAVDWSRYRVAGFSLMFSQTFASLIMARALKERFPDLKIVMGGPSADSEMGAELLKGFSWIDYVVHGEAEESFPLLLHQIISGAKQAEIPGVSFRHAGQVTIGFQSARPLADLNNSPAPDYTEYFAEATRLQLTRRMKMTIPFESARGCWWGAKKHCTFCGLNGTTMAFRKKAAERVYQEVFDLSRRYRNLTLAAVDNILDMKYFHELLPHLAEQDHDLALFYEVKANLTREQVRLMAAAGITQIQPGIESLSSSLLKLMNKGVTAIQNIQLLKWCREFGIEPVWNILYGFPGERAEEYEDFPRIMRCLFHLKPPIGVSPVIFERFSPYHFDREKYGLTLSPWPAYHFLYPSDDVNLEKIAYYFNGTCSGLESRTPAYLQPILETYKQWLALWKSNNVIFQYEVGPGFVILYDSRFDSRDGKPVMWHQMLNEIQSIIYLFCDEVRSVSAIMEKLAETQEKAPSEKSVRALLARFVEQGLMFGEGDRFLSLAVRKQPQRAYILGRPREHWEKKSTRHSVASMDTPAYTR